MFDIVIYRDKFFDGKASLGTCIVYNTFGEQVFKSESLERGWLDNQNMISCIPVGVYDCVLEYSPAFDTDLWELKGVPGRSECKFHIANYWTQLNGCIGLGKERYDLDKDGVLDVTNSGDTMDLFHEALLGEILSRVHVFDVLKMIR